MSTSPAAAFLKAAPGIRKAGIVERTTHLVRPRLVLNPYRAVTADESGVHNATGLHDNLQRSKTVSGEIDAVNDLVSLVENGPGLKQDPRHLTFDRAQSICRKRRQ
jgi:hypothetical protein